LGEFKIFARQLVHLPVIYLIWQHRSLQTVSQDETVAEVLLRLHNQNWSTDNLLLHFGESSVSFYCTRTRKNYLPEESVDILRASYRMGKCESEMFR